MSEFLHEIVRKQEQLNYSTSNEFQAHINAIMEGNRRQLLERMQSDPWAAVEARNADEELHYSGGNF